MDTVAKWRPKRHFKLKMPGAFTILFILTIVAVIATWFVPAGSYSKLSYNEPTSQLEIKKPNGTVEKVPATQAQLDKMGVKIDIKQFTSGGISQAISIPNTYHRLKQRPASVAAVPESMVQGVMEAVDIMVFIFVLGGLIGVVRASGAFESGLMALTKKTKGHEFLLIFLVSVLMVLGGTLCGIEEEAVAFYPILVPVFIAMGYDSIVCVGAIFLASSIGTCFSTINPFSVVIASNAAGINFTQGLNWRIGGVIVAAAFVVAYLHWYSKKVKANPKFSYSYEDRDSFDKMWSVSASGEDTKNFSIRKKIILILFAVTFPIMVWGVMAEGWGFPIMAASFLTFAIVIMFMTATGRYGIGEKGVVDAFVEGSSSLVGVSLIIGLARGINLILNNGMISDTMLQFSSNLVSNMSGPVFIIVMLLIFFVLGFVVPSSSGLAVLSMPILAPLADTVHIPRFVVVTAYQFGQYAMLFLAPTGLVMATLQMLDMKYSHWLRFVWPVVAFVLIFGGGILVAQVLMY
ncbi:TRAP transporter large permease subunit [Secundilactobacillus kimchicus]|uniref:YfcC family protein n=1 Tax=Secundilactobacillus kimchicus TaxID=528209 RepID=UPI001C013F22|nr:YfcC family protein [Secundilactobacillus kimchicus]MBT9671920.1 TRAP transporter large permease subunit [Secundilactobacillus kimchicus]